MKPPKPDLERARRAARRLVLRSGARQPGDIDVVAMAWEAGVIVLDGPIHGSEGRLVRRGRRGIVRVHEGIREPGRRRLTIAHELGHWVLHGDATQLPLLCEVEEREDDDYASSPLELEATAFASELVLPAPLFVPLLNDAPTLEDVRRLADAFGTTLTATVIRLVQSLPHTFVAFSEYDGVTWWKRCESRRGGHFLWLQKRQPVHRESMAWKCHQGAEETERVQVPWEAWFAHLRSKRPVRVWEQAMKLGAYDTVMSLLTLEQVEDTSLSSGG